MYEGKVSSVRCSSWWQCSADYAVQYPAVSFNYNREPNEKKAIQASLAFLYIYFFIFYFTSNQHSEGDESDEMYEVWKVGWQLYGGIFMPEE